MTSSAKNVDQTVDESLLIKRRKAAAKARATKKANRIAEQERQGKEKSEKERDELQGLRERVPYLQRAYEISFKKAVTVAAREEIKKAWDAADNRMDALRGALTRIKVLERLHEQ